LPKKEKIMSYYFVGLSDSLVIPSLAPADYTAQKFLEKISYYLKEFGYMKIIDKQDNFIKFSGSPLRFIWNGWNLFNPVSHGLFEVNYGKSFITIDFQIFFWEFLFFSFIFSIPALVIPGLNPLLRSVYLVAIWSLFIFHTFWVKLRLKKLIYKTISIINEQYLDSVRNSEGLG